MAARCGMLWAGGVEKRRALARRIPLFIRLVMSG